MTTVIGGYEVLGELGRGGMGRVLRVRHAGAGAVRALKVIEGFVDAEALARLRREGEAQARAAGDGVVPVHEAGVDRGRAFLVMALMPGGSLRDRLRREGRLEWREACALVSTLARALHRCHAAGLVHRDLKPENVLFDEDGAPRLADFGCVRDLGAATLTATGATIGTLAYMAPEQVDGGRVGPAADVYALGVILHELVAGERPFRATGHVQLMKEKVAPDRPRPRLAQLAGAPPALDDIVGVAMALDPEQRPEAGELAAMLDRAQEGVGSPPPRVATTLAVVVGAAALVAVLGAARAAMSATTPAPSVAPAPRPLATTTEATAAAQQQERADARLRVLRAANALEDDGRPAADSAALVRGVLDLADDPARQEVAHAALARLERRSQATPTDDGVATLHDAVVTLSIAAGAGVRMDGLSTQVIDGLTSLVRRGNDQLKASSGHDPRDAVAVGQLLSDLAPLLRSGLKDYMLLDALVPLAETCEVRRDVAPAAVDGARAALEALVELRPERARPAFVLGKLLGNRVLGEPSSSELRGPARACLAEALRRGATVDGSWSRSDWAVTLLLAAHLAELDGEPAEAEALLASAPPDVLDVFRREDGKLGANMLYVRARARLAQGQAEQAAADLEGGARHVRRASRPGDPFEERLTSAARRLREGASPPDVLASLRPLDPL